jgi:hypothetical protein
MRNIPGGPAPAATKQRLKVAAADLSTDQTWTSNKQEQFKTAEKTLLTQAEELIDNDI